MPGLIVPGRIGPGPGRAGLDPLDNYSGCARSEIRACKGILPNKATFVVARSFDPKLCFVEKIGINFVITRGLFESTN